VDAVIAPVASNGGLVIAYLIILLIGIAAYIFTSYCLMKMAEKLGVPNGWFAFIPFLNYWLLCQMDEKENSWFIIMLIFSFCFPIVTMVMAILIMMDVAEKLGFESWWGILLIIPIFNFYVVYKLAFTEP
jgi:hypothetical protein